MSKRRILTSIILIIIIGLIFVGCINNKVTDESKVDLFKQKEAMNVAKKYLEYLSSGDIESASTLYAEEPFNKNKDTNIGEVKINSFIAEDLIEAGQWSYAIFNVVRSPVTGIHCDLDSITIKVVKENLQYKIAEVKSVNKQHIFEKNNGLRIVGEGGSKSELITNLSNIPKGVYLKEGDVTLNKEMLVNKEFGHVALSYTAEKVAITTLGDNKAFVCVANIEKSKKTQGNVEGKSSNEAAKEENLEGLLEKPIAQKITPIDILSDVNIKNIAFSELEEELIVEYTEKTGSERINIYKESNGELIPLKLDKLFPKEKYNIKFKGLDKKKVFANVSGRNGVTDIENELIGDYEIDISRQKVSRL